MHSVYSTSGKAFSTKPVKVQYSYDGKKYTTMNKNLTLQPGKTIYIRIQLKNKLWIRKDGKGFLALANKY